MTEEILNSQQAVERIFQNLTLWRNLPKYQLERRADMFFGLYVKDIVKHFAGSEDLEFSDIIIPEFPIRKKPKNNEETTRRTVNVDYVIFSIDRITKNKIAYFVELKTDMRSRNDVQDNYLNEVNEKDFLHFAEDLMDISSGSKQPDKYEFLFNCLKQSGVIHPSHSGKVTIKVVYIQPEKDDKDCITFHQISEWLNKQHGEFPKLFGHYLCLWTKKAGKA